MGRYEKLVGNTLVFAIGSFSSKLLVFFMLRYYTAMLTVAEFGIADRITTTSNLLMPFVMLSVNEAIIRFAMDRSLKRSDVFSIGLKTVLAGFIVFCMFSPVMLMIDMLSPYTLVIYIYVLFGMLKAICAQFIRSIGLVKLFAFDGFLATFTTIAFNILFLTMFRWGLYGYVISIIASNIISIFFLFIIARLDRYVDFTHPNPALRREMLRYSVPLIPTTMFWWIVGMSDRYMVTWFCGDTPTGMLAIAHKIPSLLTIVSAIFYQAWQISAVDESGQGKHTTRFYSQTYDYYCTLLFCAASGIVMLIQPITKVMYDPAYYESWKYVPFLVMAEVFSSLVTFLGSFYMVSKKNATVPLAIFIGAVANIGLNFLLIPRYGVMGASFATLLSYLLAYAIRAVDIQRLVSLELRPLSTAVCMLLIMVQGALLIRQPHNSFLIQLGMFLLMLALNLKSVLRLGFALFDRFVAPHVSH
ncbi:MAG: polysaccharide biosynthesis C-terminal domain-containing protein [Candidatus Fimivivens sp.]|nr:polysaccharide biosynthesis C-terminal domain-containing protein [Candidatus Fimivivens sp.]